MHHKSLTGDGFGVDVVSDDRLEVGVALVRENLAEIVG